MEPQAKRLRINEDKSSTLGSSNHIVGGVNLEELPEEISADKIKDILDAADEIDIDIITANNIDRAVTQLERKLKRNEQQRLRYPDEPEKFLKSEVDLDEEIQRIHQIAASPQLISLFIQLNGLNFLIPLLQHANTDLAGEVINVLAEFTSPESILELDDPIKFANIVIDDLGLPSLLAELLARIKEAQSDEDYTFVTHCLQVVENLSEISPSLVAESFALKSPKFVPWLVRRIRLALNPQNPICYNRVYATEILSIILQNSQKCRQSLGRRDGLDGLEKLLRCFAVYRKQDALGGEEEEYLQNLGDSIAALLQESENRYIFGQIQGIELMIRLMRDRMKSFPIALKLTAYALENNKENCRLFVEKLGLKSLFGIFMRRGVNIKPAVDRELEECIVSIILHLCRHTRGTATARLLNKFTEKKCEKLERLLELHQKYFHQVQIGQEKRRKVKDVEDIAHELELDEEDQEYLERCENGLFILQSVDNILVRLTNMGNVLASQRVHWLLNVKGISINEIHKIVNEYLLRLDPSAEDEHETIKEYLENFVKGIVL